jgi:hypothetical protein
VGCGENAVGMQPLDNQPRFAGMKECGNLTNQAKSGIITRNDRPSL